MSKENPTQTISQYYKRFWRQFSREIRKAVWEAVIAIIAIVAVIFLQFYYGWINREQGVLSALQNIAPAAAIAVAYIVRHVIKTPWVLDVEREREIGQVSSDLASAIARIDSMASELTRPNLVLKNPSIMHVGEF